MHRVLASLVVLGKHTAVATFNSFVSGRSSESSSHVWDDIMHGMVLCEDDVRFWMMYVWDNVGDEPTHIAPEGVTLPCGCYLVNKDTEMIDLLMEFLKPHI